MSTISSVDFNTSSPLINNIQLNSDNLLSENISKILEEENTINTISDMGKQINKLYSFSKSTKNSRVIEGFNTSMFILRNQLTSQRAINFFRTAEQLTYGNAKTFTSLFSSVNALNKNGLAGVINNFMDAVNSIAEKIGADKLDSFLEKTDNLGSKLRKENSKNSEAIMFSFFNTVSQIANNSDKQQSEELLNEFLNGLESENTSTAIDNYIKNFRETNL